MGVSPAGVDPIRIGSEPGGERPISKKEVSMLETILIILVVLWALGLFAFHAGGLIHVLLVIAVIVLIVRLLQGRKVL